MAPLLKAVMSLVQKTREVAGRVRIPDLSNFPAAAKGVFVRGFAVVRDVIARIPAFAKALWAGIPVFARGLADGIAASAREQAAEFTAFVKWVGPGTTAFVKEQAAGIGAVARGLGPGAVRFAQGLSLSSIKIRASGFLAFTRIVAGLNRLGLARIAAGVDRRAPRSLTNRIVFIQLVWTLVIYLLVIVVIWFASSLVIENSVRHQAAGWVTKLDELGIPIYATKDPAQIKQVNSYLANFQEIARAKYLDGNGHEVIAEYTRPKGTVSWFPALTPKNFSQLDKTEDASQKPMIFDKGENSQMRVIAPIWVKSISSDGMVNYSMEGKARETVQTIGFVELVLDYSKISSELNRNIFYASLVIAALMLVAGAVMRITVRWSLRPLSDLEEPLSRLAAGETDIIVSTSGDKEIASIGAALNTTISALRERDEALRRMIDHDSLTGLVNRAYFVERLEQEVKRVSRSGGCSALFFFDLDRFKNINDTYGHAAGDRLLIQVAKQLRPRVREHDVFARYGGDEFTLLAYNVDQAKIQELAESFISLMREFVFYEAGDSIKIYFSIGVTLLNNATLSAHEYLKEADTAVHQAKNQGRNCFRIYERDTRGVVAETGIGWHKRLEEALHTREVILYFQPMQGLKGQPERISEVLLRLPDMDHPGRNKGAKTRVISPGAFLSAAERFGMMQEFDSLVIDKSAEVLSGVKDEQLELSVNLSEQFFGMEDIPAFLEKVTQARKVKPEHFIFELSQSYISRNISHLQELLADLSLQGFRFAIDDFGADFSAFNYIRKFPAHLLKIDGSLVERIATDKIAKATVNAIVEIATELHMQTIAKNVTTSSEAEMLKELGVDFIQGNFIAAPSPILYDFGKKRPVRLVKVSG